MASRSANVVDLTQWETRDNSVLTLDGFGLSLTVSRRHLVLRDGIGCQRRQRRLPRAQRAIRRIVILGHTGHVSLEAIRFCHDTGITLFQLSPEGEVLLTGGPHGPDDARLRRAQAAAAASPVGLEVAKSLIGAKLRGQAAVARECLAHTLGDRIEGMVSQVQTLQNLAAIRDVEAQAANEYFASWSRTVRPQFATNDLPRVPTHWTTFTARSSPLHRGGRSPRKAADPVNALLNYSYALAEAEARIAAQACGLDPGLGIVHTDKKNRDSLALDLLEPLRPIVDSHVIRLLQVRHLRATDFHETANGTCRLLPPLTHELAAHLPIYARHVARHAEAVAHALARSAPGRIELRSPLSRDNTRAAQHRGARSANRKPPIDPAPTRTCRTCGELLTDTRRQLCPTCWPITRRQIALDRATAANQALASLRALGNDPTNSAEAAAKRSARLAQRKREERAWLPDHEWSEEQYREMVLPKLAEVPLSAVAKATGLSISACSRIRSGKLLPHRRHWRILLEIATLAEGE